MPKSKNRHLAIVITRHKTKRGSPGDEFAFEWLSLFPLGTSESKVLAANYMMVPGDEQHRLMVIHGDDELFALAPDRHLDRVILGFIGKENIDLSEFEHLWICVHGSLPQTGNRVEERDLGELAKKGPQAHSLDYSGGGESAAQALLDECVKQRLPNELCDLIENSIRVVPIVELRVREMQGLIMQIRLVVEMMRQCGADQWSVSSILPIIQDLRKKISIGAMQKVLKHLYNHKDEIKLGQLTFAHINDVPKPDLAPKEARALRCLFLVEEETNLAFIADLSDKSLCLLSARLELVREAAPRYERMILRSRAQADGAPS